MDIILSPVEARILGSLIEKEFTTPDYYPLTLNALTNACNQKSNREPVMNLDEKIVVRGIEGLFRKQLVWQKNMAGSRTVKFAHRIETFGDFTAQELGTLCILLLRGPQTAGEIRSRTTRLCEFNYVSDVEETLQRLVELENGPYVIKLPRQVGRRESRYAHLLSGEVKIDQENLIPQPESSALEVSAENERISSLEQEVAKLRTEFDNLNNRFIQFIRQFE